MILLIGMITPSTMPTVQATIRSRYGDVFFIFSPPDPDVIWHTLSSIFNTKYYSPVYVYLIFYYLIYMKEKTYHDIY